MSVQRLDKQVAQAGLASTRSQAENLIKLGQITVDGVRVTKPALQVSPDARIEFTGGEQFVSRAALKLKSAATKLKLEFTDKIILDVGSSTGGFTDYALRRGAKKVIAVEVGTDQMHPSLRSDSRVDLHEQTDIREFQTTDKVDIVLIDVSFISLRKILPQVSKLIAHSSLVVAMVKPQFETQKEIYKHKGVIKNEKMRREIMTDFEDWTHKLFKIVNKSDSEITGVKGNRERFYLLKLL